VLHDTFVPHLLGLFQPPEDNSNSSNGNNNASSKKRLQR